MHAQHSALRATLSQDEMDGFTAGAAGNVEAVYPLTPLQQGMLFHILAAPDSGMYLNQQRDRLRGELDVAALRQSLQEVIDRHQVLRSAFVLSPQGEPLQVVYRRLSLHWDVHDWRGLGAAEKAERLDALARADLERGFDLSQAPLMRMTLVRTDEDRYELMWSFHLMLLDGWSVPIIFRELLQFYHGFRSGRLVEPEPPASYGDYINWLRGQRREPAEAFWRDELTGFTRATSLGADRAPLAADAPEVYGERVFRLDESATAALRAFAARNRLTLNTVIQGAWALLLGRRGGSDDVLFGSVVSGRPVDFHGADSVVGMFLNTLPVRVRVPADGPLAPWLAALQLQQVEARRFEFCSLVDVQGWSEVPRGQPLFESVLILQNVPLDAALSEAQGLRLEVVSATERTNYPLTLIVEPGRQLLFKLVYRSSRFDDATVGRIAENLRRTLEEMATNPAATLSTLAARDDAERRRLIAGFNQSLSEL